MANVAATTLSSAMAAAAQAPGVFVADFMAPRVKPIGFQALSGGKYAFSYPQVGVDQGNGTDNYIRSEGADVIRLNSTFTDVSATADEWALEYAYDVGRAQASPTFNERRVADQLAAPKLTERRMISRDKAVYTLLADSSLSGYTLTGDGSSVGYWDAANTNPLLHLQKGVGSVLRNGKHMPNRFVLSRNDAISLQNNPYMRSRFGDAFGGVTLDQLATILSGELGGLIGKAIGASDLSLQVRIAGASTNTATEGQTASRDYIFATKSWLGYVPETPNFEMESGLYQYEIVPLQTDYYLDNKRRQHVWQASEVVGEGIPRAACNYVFASMTQTRQDAP